MRALTPLQIFFLALAICMHAPAQSPVKAVQERLGYPASARLLIIHADDFGMNHSVNRATSEALVNHWITSASILVPCPWFLEAAAFAKAHPDLDLGIHQDLNSEWTYLRWGPVSSKDKVPSLLDADGYLPLDTPQVAKNADPTQVEAELRAQIERAQKSGVHITHLDTHMAALFGSPDLYKVYLKMGYSYHLPILEEWQGTHGPLGINPPQEEMLVQKVISIDPGVNAADWMGWYEKQLAPLGPGVYEVIIHLAYDDDEMRGATFDHADWGAAWRQQDLDMVKSAEFQKFLKDQGFVLVGWKDLAKALPKEYGTKQ
jgi:chitin disaccharide deacetylase